MNREFPVTIAANSGETIEAPGNFIYLHTASLPLKVYVEGQLVTMRERDSRGIAKGFRNIRVENNNGSDVASVFVIGEGAYSRGRMIGDVSVNVGGSLETAADASATASVTSQILAANSIRHYATLTNLSGTVTLRIGDSNAGATRGSPLGPGDSTVIHCTDSIHAYNPDASAVSVAISEVTD